MTPAHRRRWIAVVLAIASVLGLAVIVSRSRESMRLNRLTYLVNDHRFTEALQGFIDLKVANPDSAARLPEFEAIALDRAEAFYRTQPQRSPLADDDFAEVLDLAETQPGLASKVRRMRLRLALDAPPSPPTDADSEAPDPVGEAARAILRHDGFVLDALYWTVASQYHDTLPLQIPPVLLDYREQVEAPLPAGEESSPAAPRQRALLLALLALADRNWGGAVYEFERLAALGNDQHDYELAYGSALLRSGEYSAAASVLRHYHRLHPDRLLPVREWAAAAMRGGDLMQAAAVIDRLAAMDRNSVAPWMVQWLPGGLDSLATGVPAAHGAPTLVWVLHESTGATARYSDWLAAWLAAQPAEALPRHAGELLAMSKLAGPAAVEVLDRHVDTALAGPAQDGWQRLAAALLNTEREPLAVEGLLKHEVVNQLHAHQTTARRGLKIDPRSSYLALQVTGYAADGVWPLIHIDAGSLGEQHVYVRHGRGDFMPVVFPIIHPVRPSDPAADSGAQPIVELSYTLQNGDWTARDQRNLLIVELFVL